MSKEKFIESNRRTPDLAPLTDDFFSELYDEILVNEIKMEGAEDPVATAAASAATVSPRSSTPKGTPKGGQRKRRGSLSDMFAPGADGKALSVADQKQVSFLFSYARAHAHAHQKPCMTEILPTFSILS